MADYPAHGLPNWDDDLKAYIDAAIEERSIALPEDSEDGQGLIYNSALSAWEPANPTGNSRIGSNRNVTGTLTNMTAASGTNSGYGGIVTIPSTGITALASNGRPCVIRYGAEVQQTLVGVGWLQIFLYETTTTPVVVSARTVSLSNSGVPIGAMWEWDGLGVVTTPRTFELRARLVTTSASFSGYIVNTAAAPSWARVLAE